MRALDRKVLRDVMHLKGQLLAVAVLVACGVAVFIMLRSMYGYLTGSQETYYAQYGFGEVFAHATRVPAAVEERLRGVPGVAALETRIVRDVMLDVPGLAEPATGRMVSLPDHGEPRLNRLHLRSGAYPQAGRRDQVVVSAAFAEANGLRVGDAFGAVLNGRWQRLTVVGTALSPEFIYEISGTGGMFPDNRRFGAMWMSRGALAAAFEMEGAFNDVVATLAAGVAERAVLDAVDDLLERYGGTGAYGRDDHLSHQFVSGEIDETQITATFFPALFLVITAFLLHTTLLRLVRMEREAIGLLKAFGVWPRTVAAHYLKLALLPVGAGAMVGAGGGIWLADRMAGVYARFFQFPELDFQLDPGVVGWALLIALATGMAGALAALRSVVGLAPAVAMAPPAPPRFTGARFERTRAWRALRPAGRMIVRNVTRARWKSLSTTLGIAMALGVLGALLSMFDAIDVIADLQFRHIYREDMAVYFETTREGGALREVARLPGVLAAEPIRVVPARLVYGHREERTALLGLQPGTRLRRIVDADRRVHPPPPEGVLLNAALAGKLGVGPGDVLRVEVTEGERAVVELPVAGTVAELLMANEVYLEAATLYRILGESGTVSGAWLRVDPRHRDELYARLKALPGVSTVLVKEVVVQGFRDTIEESFLIALTSTLVLGGLLVMAIVYNQARVALSERGRELASLRVLGFSRREVARMLLGEQAVLVAAAVPLGIGLGWGFTWLIMRRFESDLFRLPVVAEPATYLQAVGLVLASAALSAYLVRRRLDRIDLIAVLKTRE
ncbi:MAG: ABC transporter permease [Longimicrobiales bacterium]|nr:ABC transporter permease [Longimicrobiales bacterium]